MLVIRCLWQVQEPAKRWWSDVQSDQCCSSNSTERKEQRVRQASCGARTRDQKVNLRSSCCMCASAKGMNQMHFSIVRKGSSVRECRSVVAIRRIDVVSGECCGYRGGHKMSWARAARSQAREERRPWFGASEFLCVAAEAHKQKALCRALSEGGRGFTTSVHACPLVRDVSDRARSSPETVVSWLPWLCERKTWRLCQLLCFQWRKGWGKWMIRYVFYCRFDTTTSSLSIYQRLRCFEVVTENYQEKQNVSEKHICKQYEAFLSIFYLSNLIDS